MTTERLSIGDMVESDNGPLLGGTTPECFVTHLHMCSDGHVQAAWQRLNTRAMATDSVSQEGTKR